MTLDFFFYNQISVWWNETLSYKHFPLHQVYHISTLHNVTEKFSGVPMDFHKQSDWQLRVVLLIQYLLEN